MSKKNPYNLTDKQFRFCQEYMIDLNASGAASRAGYSQKTAKDIGCENLAKPNIQKYISELKAKTSEKLEVTHDMLTREWFKIAFSSIAHLHKTWIDRKDFEDLTDDQKECIESIDTKIVKEKRGEEIYDVEYVKIKLYDKSKALVELGKHSGYYEKDNKQKAIPLRQIINMSDYKK